MPDVPMKKKTSIPKLILGNLLVTAVLLLLAECGYRGSLNRKNETQGLPYHLTATSGAMLGHDPDFGYNYVPNHLSHSAILKEGQVVRLYTNRVNSVGMTTREDTVDPTAARRILVVGDSFTALTYSEGVWSDWMHDAMEAGGENVGIHNAGRDGYGVLQMVHAAAVLSGKQDFTDLVIAFITDDLTRGRFWRYHVEHAAAPRVVTSTEADPAKLSPPYVDTYLLDARVRPDWALGLIASPGASDGDGLVRELIGQAQARRRDFFMLPRRTAGASVLWNQVAHGDPYHHLNQRGRNPRHRLASFADDAQFRKDAAILRGKKIRMTLARIPDLSEWKDGKYRTDARTESLCQSLAEALGQDIHELLPDLLRPGENAEDLFLVPHDNHPNVHGMRRIGGAIADLLARPTPP